MPNMIDPFTMLLIQVVGGTYAVVLLLFTREEDQVRGLRYATAGGVLIVLAAVGFMLRAVLPTGVSTFLAGTAYIFGVAMYAMAYEEHEHRRATRLPLTLAGGSIAFYAGLVALGAEYVARTFTVSVALVLLLSVCLRVLCRDRGLAREPTRWFSVVLLATSTLALVARIIVLLPELGTDGSFLERGLEQTLALGPSVLLAIAAGPGYVLMLHQRAAQRASHLSTIDTLTGCLNRRALLERVRISLADASRRGDPLTLLVLDFDRFKSINDTHGHAAGDEVLRKVAARVQGMIRPADCLARIGGEEFCLVLPRTARHGATVVAERLLDAVRSRPVVLPDGTAIPVTLSIGAAVLEQDEALAAPDTAGWDDLFQRADRALLEAKRSGRDRLVLAPGGMERADSRSRPLPSPAQGPDAA
ncbi:MAG: GGDEF domain-containing protein [Deltaproteobacteria bacterium]|nr:MAG: GGDEF domain-containing protein [Deltaproteobacteria bacterium]